MCTFPRVYTPPCLHSTVYTLHRVYTPPCVNSTACTLPCVYTHPCVHSIVCTLPRMYTPPCVHSPVCSFRRRIRGLLVRHLGTLLDLRSAIAMAGPRGCGSSRQNPLPVVRTHDEPAERAQGASSKENGSRAPTYEFQSIAVALALPLPLSLALAASPSALHSTRELFTEFLKAYLKAHASAQAEP